MNSFAPKEQKIAKFILDFPGEVVNMSIEELADACGTSMSSVVRLCKSANYAGYKELCRMLFTDLALEQQEVTPYNDVRPGDSTESIVQSVCSSNIKSIENTRAFLDTESLDRAIDALCIAKRVDFYGVGTSGIIAMDAHNKFVRINKMSMSSSDPHDQILCATSLQKGDVAVLISYSGDTKDILETAEIIRKTDATIISITCYSKNPLSQKADISLYSSSSETLIRSGVMGQRIGQLTVIDILYTAVVSRLYGTVKIHLDETRLLSARKHLHAGSQYQ
jgi:DNA-binding MurR/RpiR family transcriptional regulator